MSSLYELSNEFLQAKDQLESFEDIDPQVIADTIEALSGTVEDKAIAVAKFIQNEEATAKSIDDAIKQMTARKKTMQASSERFRAYLKENMERTGITEIACDYFALKIKNNPKSVAITDESLIPSKFKKESIVVFVDKTAINNAGGCEGAEIVQKTRLEIK